MPLKVVCLPPLLTPLLCLPASYARGGAPAPSEPPRPPGPSGPAWGAACREAPWGRGAEPPWRGGEAPRPRPPSPHGPLGAPQAGGTPPGGLRPRGGTEAPFGGFGPPKGEGGDAPFWGRGGPAPPKVSGAGVFYTLPEGSGA